jgi:hypothetical protein
MHQRQCPESLEVCVALRAVPYAECTPAQRAAWDWL